MPINYKDYSNNWKWLSKQIRQREGNKCYFCGAENGKPHWKTGSKVVLTVHHIDGDKTNNNLLNLLALCQRCHLRLDLLKHITNRKTRQERKK